MPQRTHWVCPVCLIGNMSRGPKEEITEELGKDGKEHLENVNV